MIESNRYGQLPLVEGHDDFNVFQVVIDEWHEKNTLWSRTEYKTKNLPIAVQLRQRDSSDKKHLQDASIRPTHGSGYQLHELNASQKRILQDAPPISSMSGMQATHLAIELGYKGRYIKTHTAKAYLKRLQNAYGLP